MVKRKRTLSSKDSTDATHLSDVDQVSDDAKRVKSQGSPGRPEGDAGGDEAADIQQSPIGSPTSPNTSITTATSQGTVLATSTVPVTLSQPLPDVPLSTTPVVTQTRPTLQLRTSARVLNKQRREEIKADHTPSSSLLTKKSDAADGDFAEEDDALGSGIGKKRRRAWELWSMEDKNIFFESINECGKDFEAIQNYLTTKLRKKGARSQIKNKDQVRHFYYRTWHKISKHITFNEGVKKATQELYGLINYGELRKKIGGTLDERKAQKLQELIRKGSTSVRVKGKSVRVRTPICRALKKLNQIEENRENAVLRVPASIMVEVVPASMHAWCRVHGLAHNPRVRVTSPLQRPLAVLISHLQEKWRSSNLKLCDTLSSRVTFPLELQPVIEPILRLTPAKGYFVKPINVQPEVLLKSSCVSLSSHEARLRRRGEKVGRSNKRKETKQQQEKDTGLGMLNSDGDRHDSGGSGDAEGKCRDAESLGMDLEDFGDVSQEEHEDCSDGEAGCLNSPDCEVDEIIRLSPEKNANTNNIPYTVQVKEEPLDVIDSSANKDLDPDIQVKEESEGESGDTLRQLLALETVANAGVADDDAEVICTGESTRLTAHVGDAQRGSNSASQVTTTEEDRGSAATPELEEEERNPGAEAEEGAEDMEAKLQKIREGLTLSTVGGITIGELYLMFGQNKKICLEYEFEDPVHEMKDNGSSSADFESPTRITNAADSSDMLARKAVTEAGTSDIPGASMAATLTVEREKLHQNRKKESAKISKLELEQNKGEERGSDVNMFKEKRAAVENLSGMLAQLVAMARVILSKSSTESCLCGHICGRSGNAMRSPASGRSHGTLGFGRSPGHARSPRTGKVTTASGQIPGINSPGATSSSSALLSPLLAKPLRDRVKPSSAKRLIPELPDQPISVRDERTDEGSTGSISGVEVSFLSPVSCTVIPSIATTTISTSQETGHLSTPAVTTGSSAPVTGLRAVLGGGGEAGEFKVPLGPAPRQVHAQQASFNAQLSVSTRQVHAQQASFNAQLSKLLPRYNNRPGRRVVRKNVVVQHQLPLLPKAVIQPAGVVTMNVLKNPSYDKVQSLEVGRSSGYISIAPSLHGVAASTDAFTSARPQSLSSSSTHPIRNPIIQPLQSQVGQNVVASQVQLSVVPHNLQQVPPAIAPLPAVTNAISVNISGQPLFTVEMPASVPVPPLIGDSTSKLSSGLLEMTHSAAMNTISSNITSTPVSALKNTTSVNGLLSSMVSQALSDLPDLSTPPGTPQPSQSSKSLNCSGSVSFVRNLGDIGSSIISIADPCPQMPSSSLFNSALSVESLPSLGSEMMTNNSLVTTLPHSLSSTLSPCLSSSSPPPTSCVTSALSPISTLLTNVSTHHLQLSSPPSHTNSFTSLLNTPTAPSSNSIPSTPICCISPSPPSISSLLSSSSPDLNKSFTTILASSDQENSSMVAVSSANVPELHIPEGSVNLPLLDISLGGTVTITDQATNLLSTDPHSSLVDLASTTVTSTPMKSSPAMSTMIGMNSMQETSSDKLLDITLGISNSNSSFSSLLAAATQPRCLDSSLLDIPSIVGDNSNGRVNGADGSNMSAAGISGFPALSTTPPSPPSSPSRLLQQSDNQWLNSEVNDFSFSSFLGHFESPVKSSSSRGSSHATPSGSFVPSLSSVYNENSVDFTATFAEMKAQVSGVFKQ
nr:uncharacterized protein LOC123772892 isoform X2 [Procambarus clarkii]